MNDVFGATFIRNAFEGGFAIFESLIPVLAITDGALVIDMGSTDGTLQALEQIAAKNKRLKIYKETWTKLNDASTFADVANRCVELAPTTGVLFWQADEIIAERLAKNMAEEYKIGNFDMTVCRIQLSHNFSTVKWLPHPLCRSLNKKSNRRFVGDGMSVDDVKGCKFMCPIPDVPNHPLMQKPHKNWAFPWHEPLPGRKFDNHNPRANNNDMVRIFPWEHFLIDTSSSFRDNQIAKKALHAPFWRESPDNIDGKNKNQWIQDALRDPNWVAKTSPFPLPSVCKGLVGMTKYALRNEIRRSLEDDSYEGWGY